MSLITIRAYGRVEELRRVPAGSSATASIMWTVLPGYVSDSFGRPRINVADVLVEVDQSNLIVESNESNNSATRNLLSIIDTDGDDLSDYEEVNGMRVAYPHKAITTNPTLKDTDLDGLSDSEEMGAYAFDQANLDLFNSVTAGYDFHEYPYDGYHFQYRADPNRQDSDNDGMNDPVELAAGTNPFDKETPLFTEFIIGYILGDSGLNDPAHGNLAYLTGSISSSITPLVEYVAMVRDSAYGAITGDWMSVCANVGSGILGAVFFADPTPLEELPIVGVKLVTFILHYREMVGAVAKFAVDSTIKSIPAHDVARLLTDYVYQGVSAKITRGLGDSGIIALAAKKLDLRQLEATVVHVYEETPQGTKVILERTTKNTNGNDVKITADMLYVNSKATYIDRVSDDVWEYQYDQLVKTIMYQRGLTEEQAISELNNNGKTLQYVRDSVKNGMKSDVGKLGEGAAQRDLLLRDDLQLLGADNGVYKTADNQHGFDFICKDTKTGEYVIIEAKGTTESGSVGKGILDLDSENSIRQMDNDWIRLRINLMEDEGTISPALANDLRNAYKNGKIRKELYVTQDSPINEKTVEGSLMDNGLGINTVHIVKLGG